MEMNGIRVQTRRSMIWSFVIHVAAVLLLMLYSHVTPGPEVLTEISWVEPEEILAAPPVPEVAQTPEPQKVMPVVEDKTPEKFQRKEQLADLAPDPQSKRVAEDKLQKRLSSLTASAVTQASPIPVATKASMSVSAPAAVPKMTATGTPVSLTRSNTTKATPIEMRRVKRTAAAVATTIPETATKSEAASEMPPAVRNLAGATLVGPVADRKLLSHSAPKYPEQAKREAIEGSVRLYFVVLGNGEIKENIMVQKTSGYRAFDQNAVTALRTWRFEPLPRGQTGEQWGEITFHYRLSDGR
jgi:TonB family protein